jgi:regulator of replication initiation timing
MFKVEDHEKNITELSELLKVEGVDQAKASTILQSLRENYTEVNTKIEESTNTINKFTEINKSLQFANSDLLSKLGTQTANLGTSQNNNNNNNNNNPDDEGEKTLSFDDIANEFLK